jgi:hypothetical protein
MSYLTAAMIGVNLAGNIVRQKAGNPLLEVTLANRELLVTMQKSLYHIEEGIAKILHKLATFDEDIYKGSLQANAQTKSFEIMSIANNFVEQISLAERVLETGTDSQKSTTLNLLNEHLVNLLWDVPELADAYRQHPGSMGPGAFTVILSGYLELAVQIEAVKRIDLSPEYPKATAQRYARYASEIGPLGGENALNQLYLSLEREFKKTKAKLLGASAGFNLLDGPPLRISEGTVIQIARTHIKVNNSKKVTEAALIDGTVRLLWEVSEVADIRVTQNLLERGFYWDYYQFGLDLESAVPWKEGFEYLVGKRTYYEIDPKAIKHIDNSLPERYYHPPTSSFLAQFQKEFDRLTEQHHSLVLVANLLSIIQSSIQDFDKVAKGDFGIMDISKLSQISTMKPKDLRTYLIEYQSKINTLSADEYQAESLKIRKEIEGLISQQNSHLKEVFRRAAKAAKTLKFLSFISTALQLYSMLEEIRKGSITNEEEVTEVAEIMDEVSEKMSAEGGGEFFTQATVKGMNAAASLIKWFGQVNNVSRQFDRLYFAIDRARANQLPGETHEYWILVKGTEFHSLVPVEEGGWLGDLESKGTITITQPYTTPVKPTVKPRIRY